MVDTWMKDEATYDFSIKDLPNSSQQRLRRQREELIDHIRNTDSVTSRFRFRNILRAQIQEEKMRIYVPTDAHGVQHHPRRLETTYYWGNYILLLLFVLIPCCCIILTIMAVTSNLSFSSLLEGVSVSFSSKMII